MGNRQGSFSSSNFEKIRSETKFTVGEIEDWYGWYKNVVSDSPRQCIDIVEFKKIFSQIYSSDVEDKYFEHLFRSFDTNGDEEIDFREYMVSLSTTARGSSTQKLEWAFRVYDINNDGFISRNEMMEMFSAMQKVICDFIPESGEECKKVEDLVDDIISKLDENHDGKVSLKEFVDGSKSNPVIISRLTQINRRSEYAYRTF